MNVFCQFYFERSIYVVKKIVTVLSNKMDDESFVRRCEFSHTEALNEFMYINDIRLENDYDNLSQKIAFSLVEMGYLVMFYDNIYDSNDLIIFLPKQVNKKQYDWFKKRKKGLLNYNVYIFENYEDKKWKTVGEMIDNEIVISLLFEKLNEKLTINKKEIPTRIYPNAGL